MPSDNDQPTTMRSLEELVRTCVEDEAEYIRENKYPDDSLHEIADSCVPVYYSELAEVLADDNSLGFGPEDLPADPDGNVWKNLQAAIYERLRQVAEEAWNGLEDA